MPKYRERNGNEIKKGGSIMKIPSPSHPSHPSHLSHRIVSLAVLWMEATTDDGPLVVMEHVAEAVPNADNVLLAPAVVTVEEALAAETSDIAQPTTASTPSDGDDTAATADDGDDVAVVKQPTTTNTTTTTCSVASQSSIGSGDVTSEQDSTEYLEDVVDSGDAPQTTTTGTSSPVASTTDATSTTTTATTTPTTSVSTTTTSTASDVAANSSVPSEAGVLVGVTFSGHRMADTTHTHYKLFFLVTINQ
jgi:hypothetical protein